MLFSKELTASLILAEAAVNTSSGNWIYSKEDLKEKFGVEPNELREIVDTINDLYPDALLDDPLEQSESGELNLMLSLEMTLSYWEAKTTPLSDALKILGDLERLNKAFNEALAAQKAYTEALSNRNKAVRRYRWAKEEFYKCSKVLKEAVV